jgi:hypothetical protein
MKVFMLNIRYCYSILNKIREYRQNLAEFFDMTFNTDPYSGALVVTYWETQRNFEGNTPVSANSYKKSVEKEEKI